MKWKPIPEDDSMLYLIGTGLTPEQITLSGLEAAKKCDQIFLEAYTSKYSEGSSKKLEEMLGKKVQSLGREEVEGRIQDIVLTAKRNNVALLVFGNPLSATTHIEFLIAAKDLGVKTKVEPGISIFSMMGKTGLMEYKFGRTVSITYWEENFKPTSFYEYILKNIEIGLHTLCLLDIKTDEKRLMNVKEALELLQKIDRKKKLKDKTFIALAGMASEKEIMLSGTMQELIDKEFDVYPQSLIICGDLNEKEKEALEALCR